LRAFRLGRFVKRYLPRGLFWRSLIIIVAPVLLLMSIITYVFFERNVDMTTRNMARSSAADVAFLVALEDSTPNAQRPMVRALAARMLGYKITFVPGENIPPQVGESSVDVALRDVIAQEIGGQRDFQISNAGEDAKEIRIDTHDGALHLIVPRDRITVSASNIFILWMVGSALILLALAILFLRNQVRPIERLAFAAENFGKGRAVPDFKPYGATEVRRAAQAFLTMRERIERHVGQRTEMLAGISHDLKTPLTRMKLALAMMGDAPDIKALKADITEMERMLDEYLAFARGEGGEDARQANLGDIVREAATAPSRGGGDRITVQVDATISLAVRRMALKRCIVNLIDNALKHGKNVQVTLVRKEQTAEITVDDDGPGIPEDRREEAFRPFHRLDEGRNLQMGGSGLGLAIARDIARAHGGDLILAASPLGGLRASVRLPI
jgi:two-component system osmolarity sensor histidine kinase EnvZ